MKNENLNMNFNNFRKMFIAALVIVVKKKKNNPNIHQQDDKLLYLHTKTKRNKLLV